MGARRFVKPDPDHQLRTVSAFTQFQTDIRLTITACLDADYNLVLTDKACAKLKKKGIRESEAQRAAAQLRENCGSDVSGDGTGFAYASLRLTNNSSKRKRAADGRFCHAKPIERYLVMEEEEVLVPTDCRLLIDVVTKRKETNPRTEISVNSNDLPYTSFLVDKFQPTEEGLTMSLEFLRKWGGLAVCLISDCLLENDKQLFKTYTEKFPLPKSVFVSEYTGMQHVCRHADREAAFGSVIVAVSDSSEQLTMWPGGYNDSSRGLGIARNCLQTRGLNKAGNAVVFLSGIPHELPKPKRARRKPRYILVMWY